MLLRGRPMLCLDVAIRFGFVAAIHPASVVLKGGFAAVRETRLVPATLAKSPTIGSSEPVGWRGIS
jgi:hypothetical protein